jgi:hypothetical protein
MSTGLVWLWWQCVLIATHHHHTEWVWLSPISAGVCLLMIMCSSSLHAMEPVAFLRPCAAVGAGVLCSSLNWATLCPAVPRCVVLCCVQVLQLDEACRAAGVKLMAAAAAGPAGWYFADLLSHSYTPKVWPGALDAAAG